MKHSDRKPEGMAILRVKRAIAERQEILPDEGQ